MRGYPDGVSRVGLCEDDADLRIVLIQALRLAGHDVVIARDGHAAVRDLSPDSGVEVIVMDVGLPDSDGRDVCQALRAHGQRAPLLFLTALNGVHDRVSGFHAGGDDYLTKPFAVAELLVRIDALVRRGTDSTPAADGLRLDPTRHCLVNGDREVALTPTEYRMLAVLTARPEEVVRRRAVVAAAWPDGAIVHENTVDSFIRRLRVKLAAVGYERKLVTVRGVGYVLR